MDTAHGIVIVNFYCLLSGGGPPPPTTVISFDNKSHRSNSQPHPYDNGGGPKHPHYISSEFQFKHSESFGGEDNISVASSLTGTVGAFSPESPQPNAKAAAVANAVSAAAAVGAVGGGAAGGGGNIKANYKEKWRTFLENEMEQPASAVDLHP